MARLRPQTDEELPLERFRFLGGIKDPRTAILQRIGFACLLILAVTLITWFDRAGYLYHGRVKSLADGVREGGLEL